MTKNSLKFTVGGTIKIVAAYDYACELLKVHIIDSGKGITPEEMIKVFQKFGKVERTSAENPEGIGMGLNICQRIIRESGGEVQVFSEGADQGTTFMFSMSMHEPNKMPDI